MNYPRLLLAAWALLLPLGSALAQSPYLTMQPTSLSLSNGQVAVFQVASTNALAYQWRKDGTNLTLTDRISGVTGTTLAISPALAGDAGVYTVVATNADGLTTSDPAPLWMNLALPTFPQLPQSQTNSEGATVNFSATVVGSEPVSYQWVRYGTPLTDNGRISGTTTTNLVLTVLTAADSGWYWLTASNAAGVVACNPARLTVLTPGDLGAAANYPEGVWAGSWLPQTIVTQDGVSALRSPPTADNSSTYIETTVYGPGEISFYWAVSSEVNYDWLVCQLDGVEVAAISDNSPNWTQRTLAVGWGPHLVRWVYRKDTSYAYGYDAGFLDQVTFRPTPLVSLEMAVAPMPLPLRTYGDAAWFGQTATNHDGSSAARCGYITHNQSTTLETTVSGPGTVAFAWKVSSEYYDPLVFLVDGVAWAMIASEVDWTNRTFHIPWGRHTLSWRYQKDANDNAGARGNAAWLDEVTFTPVTLSSLTTAAGGLSPWTAGGTLPFFGQDEFTFDGSAALQSSPITHNQSSSARSGVTGPGTLTFRWKVSSESADSLRFAMDGNEQARIGGEVDWANQTYVIRPGAHVFDWSYVKDYAISQGADAGWVDTVAFVAAPTLPVSLNVPAWPWTTNGDAGWFPEMVTTHDGVAAAHSGDISHNQSTTMSTTVTGPGEITYWWKVSSEYSDPLVFLVDGVEQARIGGEVAWTNQTVIVPNGPHTLSWRYQKDHAISSGADAGWVDQVSYTSLATAAIQPTVTETSFSVMVPTVTGFTYTLEYADSLTPPISWTPILPGVLGDGTTKLLTHPVSPAEVGQRFYRVFISK